MHHVYNSRLTGNNPSDHQDGAVRLNQGHSGIKKEKRLPPYAAMERSQGIQMEKTNWRSV